MILRCIDFLLSYRSLINIMYFRIDYVLRYMYRCETLLMLAYDWLVYINVEIYEVKDRKYKIVDIL